MANIAGNLASRLEDGVPCPVCGSIHHPAPAEIIEGFIVSENDVEDANQAINTTSEALSKAKVVKDKAESESTKATEEYIISQGITANAEAVYEASLKNTIEGINDALSLEAAIKKVEGRISSFETLVAESGLSLIL